MIIISIFFTILIVSTILIISAAIYGHRLEAKKYKTMQDMVDRLRNRNAEALKAIEAAQKLTKEHYEKYYNREN